jgi:hypothetical protein
MGTENMKCIAIYVLTVLALIGAGILFHWRPVLTLGVGIGFPLFTAAAFGARCTFAKSITQIVLTKAGIWRAYLKTGKQVCEYLKAWYER